MSFKMIEIEPSFNNKFDSFDKASWLDILSPVNEFLSSRYSCPTILGLSDSWNLEWEKQLVRETLEIDGCLLSLRFGERITAGPLWFSQGDSNDPGLNSCSGCSEARRRIAVDHPLLDQYDTILPEPGAIGPFCHEILNILTADILRNSLEMGELVEISMSEPFQRHKVLRSFACPVCGPRGNDSVMSNFSFPERRNLESQVASSPLAVRKADGFEMNHSVLRSKLVDYRYGPILHIMRESTAPFAMSDAILPDSRNVGYGRALRYSESEPIAILEAYERLGGFPHNKKIVFNRSFASLDHDIAINPDSLGRYSKQQLEHPSSRILPYSPDAPMDWVWGHDIDGMPRLVPVEVGFYLYDYRFRLDYHGARRYSGPSYRRSYFEESSSGCAVGSSYEEAALHSLLELNERDAFLLAWHRGTPLPEIEYSNICDIDIELMINFIRSRGYEVHLLDITSDTNIPAIWSLALDLTKRQCSTLSAAASSPDPVEAVRSALWELTQIVGQQIDYDPIIARKFLEDPWRIELLDHHVQLYSLPEARNRVEQCAHGPKIDLKDAFSTWPSAFIETANGDVCNSLNVVADCFSHAGMSDIILIDQSTRDHTDLGLSSVKAVVPGVVPMCFGYAEQRVLGIPRLDNALRSSCREVDFDRAPYDPHPFP